MDVRSAREIDGVEREGFLSAAHGIESGIFLGEGMSGVGDFFEKWERIQHFNVAGIHFIKKPGRTWGSPQLPLDVLKRASKNWR